MKTNRDTDNQPEMREEYAFGEGQRGKYSQEYAKGSNVVVLSPDVAEVFSDSRAVNEALRMLISVAKQTYKKTG